MLRPFRSTAQHFLVRRYGRACNWECSYAEIAKATRISVAAVSRICRQHGYKLKIERPGGDFLNILPVDRFLQMGSGQIRNRY